MKDKLTARLQSLQLQLNQLGQQYLFLGGQIQDLEESRGNIHRAYARLEGQIEEINNILKELGDGDGTEQ